MVSKRIISAAAAAALIFTPTVAAAQSAPARSTSSAQAVEPAAETLEGSELRRIGIIIPLAGLLLLGLLVYLLTKSGDKEPVSP